MNQQQQEFEQIYREYSPGIRKLCLGYTGNNTLAEDLVQESFIAAWNNMHRFRGEAKLSTWIYRIAVNTCLSYLRRNRIPTENIDDHPVSELTEEYNLKEQQVQLLYKCISQLAESERLIISMVLEDKSYEEIADILQIKEGNLRVRIHRIKKQLTEIYNRHAGL